MKYNTATPYIASYVMLKKGNECLFVLRENTNWRNGYYGLPAGKVEKDETYLAAAVREAKEEAGVELKPEELQHVITCHRFEDGDAWVDVVFEASKWTGKPYNAEPKSHKEIAWLDLANLPKNVIPSLKFVLEQIQDGKVYCEYGWEK